jgi:hypothetical protein
MDGGSLLAMPGGQGASRQAAEAEQQQAGYGGTHARAAGLGQLPASPPVPYPAGDSMGLGGT